MHLPADELEANTNGPDLGILTMYVQEYGAELLDRIAFHESIAEHFPVGFCAFDRDLKVTACNSRLKELLEYPDELFEDGLPTIEDLFRFKAERGEYGPGDVESHVTSRMRLVSMGQPHRYERQLPNGKVIDVQGCPLDGGGFVTIYSDVTEQRAHTQNFEALVEGFPGGICVFDDAGRMTLHNQRVGEILDHAATLFQNPLPDFETYLRLNAKFGLYGDQNVSTLVADRRRSLVNGQTLEVDFMNSAQQIINISTMPLKNGGLVETFVDVTEARTKSKQTSALLEHFPGGIAIFDGNLHLVFHNEAFKILLGYPDSLFEHEMPSVEDLVCFNAERGEYGPGSVNSLVADRMDLFRGRHPLRFERVRPNGTALEIQITPIDGDGLLATFIDATDRLERENSDFHLANYSVTTGLPNRNLFLDRLGIAVAQAERGQQLALLRVEITRLKLVIAQTGQKTGDKVLRMLGGRFVNLVRDTDTFAHIGSDSFAVIQTGIVDPIGAEVLARRILRSVREPIEIDGFAFELDASIGIVLAPRDGTFLDDLQTKAESALHGARGLENDRICFFRTGMSEHFS